MSHSPIEAETGSAVDDAAVPVRLLAADRSDNPTWLSPLVLAALAVLCCGVPLVAAAVLATGAGVWLPAHGWLLSIPVIVLAVALLATRYFRGRSAS